MKIIVTIEFPGEEDRARAAALLRLLAAEMEKSGYVRAAWKNEEGDDPAWLTYTVTVSKGDGLRPVSD